MPDQIPERFDGLARVAAPDRLVQRPEERRAAVAQRVEDRDLPIGKVVAITVRLKPDPTYISAPT